jgi:hypothetical protein
MQTKPPITVGGFVMRAKARLSSSERIEGN